jgi:amino acid permease
MADVSLGPLPAHRQGIGLFGSFVLMFNNITGPGVVSFPGLFQNAGWALPVLYMLLCGLASGMASALVVRAMSFIAGNKDLSEKVEFATVGERVLSRRWYLLFQFVLNCSLQLVNVASIVVTVQVMDSSLVAIFGRTCALVANAHHGGFACVEKESRSASPFGDDIVISLGFLVVLVCVVPLSFWNIEDNIMVQIGAFFILIAIGCVWFVDMALIRSSGRSDGAMPFITRHQGGIVGVNMLNFAYVTTVPSWIAEKKREVGVHNILWSSLAAGIAFFIPIGIMGALTFHYDSDSDLLSILSASPEVSRLTKASTYIYPVASLMSGIPVYSIIIRENLLDGHIVRRPMAIFFAVVFPWLVAVPLGNGSGFNDLVNYGSTVLNAPVCFLLPPVLYWLSRVQAFELRRSAGASAAAAARATAASLAVTHGGGKNDVEAGGHRAAGGGSLVEAAPSGVGSINGGGPTAAGTPPPPRDPLERTRLRSRPSVGTIALSVQDESAALLPNAVIPGGGVGSSGGSFADHDADVEEEFTYHAVPRLLQCLAGETGWAIWVFVFSVVSITIMLTLLAVD